ncbi:si:dkey-190l8.2 isoform X2 [Phyllopteryx taeniolatus]|uniref:si:dkey-190l8.2 isoform X2 n=1 Tax=Phyllopteryx taeniolatus TaxID=161469 RepID=UPI002AD1FEAA|nr:si:dkey-190l8.2 isoform X2 [Phyllopteryx taeniolatus]
MHTDTLAHKHYFTHMHTDTLAHKHSFIVFSSRDEDCKLAEGEGRGHVEVSKETPAVGHNKLGPESSPHGVLKACGTFQKGRASFGMSPLQLSVLWRLSLAFFFNASLFFLDIFTAAVVEANCHNGNGTQHERTLARNQSESEELSGYESDWMTRSGDPDCVAGLHACHMARRSSWWVCCLDRLWAEFWLTGVHTQVTSWLCRGPLVAATLPFFITSCSPSFQEESTAIGDPGRLQRLAEYVTDEEVWQASAAAGVLVGAGGMRPGACCPPAAVRLPRRSLPDRRLLLLYQQLLLQSSSIPESPSWLVLMERMDVLYHYCSRSEADKQCVDLLVGSNRLEKPKVAAAPKEQPPNDFPLRHPIILRRLSIMSYLGAVTALTYFGICMNIGSFGVNVYSAQFFSGLSEAPCLLVPLVRLDRRPMSMLTLFLSGTACFLSLLLSRYQCKASTNNQRLCVWHLFVYRLHPLSQSFPTFIEPKHIFYPVHLKKISWHTTKQKCHKKYIQWCLEIWMTQLMVFLRYESFSRFFALTCEQKLRYNRCNSSHFTRSSGLADSEQIFKRRLQAV